MTVDEIKLRQLSGQHLLAPSDPLTAARDLCGVQAQFMGSALHALKIRASLRGEPDTAGLVKNWTIRGTVHIFAQADLPLFISGEHYRSNRWTAPSFWNRRADWALTPQRQAYLSNVILDALAEGPRAREELKAVCRAAGMTEAEEGSMFHPWGGGLRELCERGFLSYLAREEKVLCLAPEFTPLPREEAELELARRYFTHFGPATVHDAQYFFHTAAAQVKGWLARLPVSETECGGKTYFYIETGEALPQNIPQCLFLAGFDQLMLGYEKKENLYLAPEHLRRIFSLAGIVSPALLLDGNVAGRWKRKGRKAHLEPFSPIDCRSRSAIEEQAAALWGEDVQVIFAG